MQNQKSGNLYEVVIRLSSGKTKTVMTRASTPEVAENRAFKRTGNAQSVISCNEAEDSNG